MSTALTFGLGLIMHWRTNSTCIFKILCKLANCTSGILLEFPQNKILLLVSIRVLESLQGTLIGPLVSIPKFTTRDVHTFVRYKVDDCLLVFLHELRAISSFSCSFVFNFWILVAGKHFPPKFEAHTIIPGQICCRVNIAH